LIKNLHVHSQDSSINKRAVHSLIATLKNNFNLSISSLSVSFINSAELKKINRDYLRHNYDTDIITFNYSRKQNEVDGEILISFEEAMRNARKYKVTYGKELCRLVTHGMLHLLNFDDNNKKNKKIMKRMENKLILSYNFTLFACK
jgi:probable rRNA maturation factor